MRRIFLLTLFLLTACGGGGGSAIKLGEGDNGKTIEVTRPAQIELEIEGNASTGFVWQLAPDSSPLIKQQGEPAYVRRGDQPGAPGTYTFKFSAGETGSGRIKLVYLRPFEKERAAARTFEVTVVVKDVAISGY